MFHLKRYDIALIASRDCHMQPQRSTHYCHSKLSYHPHFLKQRFDSRPSVTFIMKEYLSKWLTSLSSTSAPFGRSIHFSEPSMNISGLSDRSSEEWKGRRSRWGLGMEVQGGMGNYIWFCRSHKWLKPCRFQSDYLSRHDLHRFPSAISLSVLLFPLLSVSYFTCIKTLMLTGSNFTVLWSNFTVIACLNNQVPCLM